MYPTEDFTKNYGWLRGTAAGGSDGLKGMWFLQHIAGFKPLINGLNFKMTTVGKY